MRSYFLLIIMMISWRGKNQWSQQNWRWFSKICSCSNGRKGDERMFSVNDIFEILLIDFVLALGVIFLFLFNERWRNGWVIQCKINDIGVNDVNHKERIKEDWQYETIWQQTRENSKSLLFSDNKVQRKQNRVIFVANKFQRRFLLPTKLGDFFSQRSVGNKCQRLNA